MNNAVHRQHRGNRSLRWTVPRRRRPLLQPLVGGWRGREGLKEHSWKVSLPNPICHGDPGAGGGGERERGAYPVRPVEATDELATRIRLICFAVFLVSLEPAHGHPRLGRWAQEEGRSRIRHARLTNRGLHTMLNLSDRFFSGALLVATLSVTAVLAGFSSTMSASAGTVKDHPQRIIIDTDLSLWWDDATAVGMANVLQQRGEAQVLGVMSDIRNPVAAAALDAIDTAYGHGKIPIGAVADSSANTAPHGYSDTLAKQLPHALRNSSQAQPAVDLYRRLLAAQPDHSVTVVAIGGDTNLAGLLASVQVKAVRCGEEPWSDQGEEAGDRGRAVPNGWPALHQRTPRHWRHQSARGKYGLADGDCLGRRVYGRQHEGRRNLCTSAPPRNPMRIVYTKLFNCGPPGDGDWDGPTMLYAIEGASGIFSALGQGGAAVINSQGGLSWGRERTIRPRYMCISRIRLHSMRGSTRSSRAHDLASRRDPGDERQHLASEDC